MRVDSTSVLIVIGRMVVPYIPHSLIELITVNHVQMEFH